MYHPKDLPNTEGFEFYALISDPVNGDNMQKRKVQRNDKGLHFVEDYKSIKAWLPLSLKQPKTS